jgi:hypothetical protein
MLRSLNSSNSLLFNMSIDFNSLLSESSTPTNINSALSPANAFTVLRSDILRKRASIYIKVERDVKRPRTLTFKLIKERFN